MVERTRSAWISGANNRLTKVGVALAHRPAELLGELVEPQVIGATVAAMMKPHPPRGRSHHTTHDPIIEVNGDCRNARHPVRGVQVSLARKSLKADGLKEPLARSRSCDPALDPWRHGSI
jgi:hypothetical protein